MYLFCYIVILIGYLCILLSLWVMKCRRICDGKRSVFLENVGIVDVFNYFLLFK